MNYKHTSAKHVISKIFRDLRINDEGWVLDAMEWIGEALEFIGHVSTTERKATELTISSHKAILPDDLLWINQVEYNGSALAYGGDTAGYDLPNAARTTNMTPNGTDSSTFTSAYTTDVNNTSNNQSGLTLRKTQNSPYGGDYYLINNGAIQTNFPDGKLKIHYSAYPTDKEGYPMVPDNVYVKQALEWYVLRQMLMGGYKHPQFDWAFADAKWGQYCVSAGNDLAYPSVDKVEAFKNMWCRLIPNINHHRDFFMATQTQEQILK
tara:strand:+ start:439 stop:1233 length:795 start_codon:yes stop_codon:yes gene_type:complete